MRARRDEWADAGVFDALADEALRAYDRIVGLDLTETAVDGSIHKACGCRKPCRGWSGGISVLVDESATAGRFHDLEVSIWLVCSVGGDGWSLIE